MNLKMSTIFGLIVLVWTAGCENGDEGNAGSVSEAEVMKCEEQCAFKTECGMLSMSLETCNEMCPLSLAYSNCILDLMTDACKAVVADDSAYARCVAAVDTCDEYANYQAGAQSYESGDTDEDFPCKEEYAAAQIVCADQPYLEDENADQVCEKELNALVEYMSSLGS